MYIMTPSGSTLARVSRGVVKTSSGSTLGYVNSDGRVMNASRSTIGRYQKLYRFKLRRDKVQIKGVTR